MIERIAIRNLGVIEASELNLGSGFTALTGETGAGKTMVLTALDLLLGGRADSGSVRSGTNQLFVEGIWQLRDEKLRAELAELGADASDEIIVNRTVSSEGRSRAAISGATVPVGTLAELAERLVAVHGQSEQLRLRSANAQREALDAFGGQEIANLLEQYRLAFDAWRDTDRRLERLKSATASDQARAEYLRNFLADMEKLDPQPGELVDIEEQINRLSNVEALRIAAATAHSAISAEDGGPDGLSLLGAARRSLESSGDPELMRMSEELSLQIDSLGEVSRNLASYLTDLEADPARLDQLQTRKAELNALCKRHGGDLGDLMARKPEAQAELLDLDSGEDQMEKLEQLLEGQLSQLAGVAGQLTAARRQAGVDFAAAVGTELANLAMAGARLEVQISDLPNFESHGADRIEILLAPHPGAAPRPLGKGASGGELSRIMLAIELVLADKQPLPTLIFDEVDAGVGGAAAVELGRRLQRLAENTQVIVVTHLPQVAAFAHHQIRIKKDSSGGFTVSSASEITGAERELELARMLSGNPESEVALQHARELLRESTN